ncbi:MAG: glycosyltransferase, partial [Longimicrobiales bacterium]|nr:glycosyltransferase [Longimicrobiales bacterium]
GRCARGGAGRGEGPGGIHQAVRAVKVRELPRALHAAWRLHRTPLDQLGRDAARVDRPLVVSFTSIPSRLFVVPTVVRSLLAQTVRPETIILWLESSLESRLPPRLTGLTGQRFQIRFRPGSDPHRKLVCALTAYPEHTVVTCDDDHILPRDWLERMWEAHRAHPHAVVAHECRRIRTDAAGEPLPYRDWPLEAPGCGHPDTLAIGYGGVLYPPGALHPGVLDTRAYRELAPTADDLWFKAMAVLRGTPVRRTARPRPKPLPIPGVHRRSLGRGNVAGGRNVEQWSRLRRRYRLHSLTGPEDGPRGRRGAG